MKKAYFSFTLSIAVLSTSLNLQANSGLKSHLLKEAQNYLKIRNVELSHKKNYLNISCSQSITDNQCLQGLMKLADASEIDGRILTENRAILMGRENKTSDGYFTPEFNFNSSAQQLVDFYTTELESVNPSLDLEKSLNEQLGINLWGGSKSYASYLMDLKELKSIGVNNKIVGEIRIFDSFESSLLHPFGATKNVKNSGPAVVFLKSGFSKEDLSEEILNALKGIE